MNVIYQRVLMISLPQNYLHLKCMRPLVREYGYNWLQWKFLILSVVIVDVDRCVRLYTRARASARETKDDVELDCAVCVTQKQLNFNSLCVYVCRSIDLFFFFFHLHGGYDSHFKQSKMHRDATIKINEWFPCVNTRARACGTPNRREENNKIKSGK